MQGKNIIDTIEMNLHMFGIVATNVLTLNEAVGNAVAMFVEQKDTKNLVIKTIIEMLKNALNLAPLLMTLIIIKTWQCAIATSITSHGSIGVFQLINAVKCHIVSNICHNLEIIELA